MSGTGVHDSDAGDAGTTAAPADRTVPADPTMPAGADQPAEATAAPRRGVRLGVDVGSVRVGVAASDPDGLLAVPVTTLRRNTSRRGLSDLDELAGIVQDRDVVEVVVGLPRHLSGREGESVRLARRYAEELAALIAPVQVRLVDERLTTVVAHRRMAERGLRSKARRDLVDQEAAVQILQHHLDLRRARGDAGPVPGDLGRPAGHPPSGQRTPGRGVPRDQA